MAPQWSQLMFSLENLQVNDKALASAASRTEATPID